MTLTPRLAISSLAAASALYIIALPFQSSIESSLFNWLTANVSSGNVVASYPTTVLYYDVVQVAVISSGLVLAFWASLRLLHISFDRRIAFASLAAGSVLTVLSLVFTTFVAVVGLTSTSRGFPLNWLVTFDDMGVFKGTGVVGVQLLIDLLFWTGLASAAFFGGILVKRRLARQPVPPSAHS